MEDAGGEQDPVGTILGAFETQGRLPFRGRVGELAVEVVKIVVDGAGGSGLTAICRGHGHQLRVPLADVIPGPVPLETSALLASYRRWCDRPAVAGWTYEALAEATVVLASPLALSDEGEWEPAEEVDAGPHPLVAQILGAGPRRAYEMEQVIPGVGPDDWDLDPVGDAAELRRAGASREAAQILQGLVAVDERCIDAWVHLGNLAFDAGAPRRALVLYDRAVAIGEQSLGAGFGGVLPWGLVDNRPFLRALHGLGLSAWRLRRWDLAERVFETRVWLDVASAWDALACLDEVRARKRWVPE